MEKSHHHRGESFLLSLVDVVWLRDLIFSFHWQVYSEIFPVWTYSYLALLVVVFLVTDFLLYKPVIVFEGICYIMTWCILIWGQGVAAMQVCSCPLSCLLLYVSRTAD